MTRFEQHLAESLRDHTVAPPPALREDVFAALDASTASGASAAVTTSGKSRRWGWAIFCGVALTGSGAIWLSESNAPTVSVPVSEPVPVPVSESVPVPVSEPVPVPVPASVSVPAIDVTEARSNTEPTASTPAVVEHSAAEKPEDLEAINRRGLQPIASESPDAVTPLTAGEETWHINASVTIKQ